MEMYDVERKDLGQPEAVWQGIEMSWETPNRCDLLERAECVARTLALRSDGNVAFRVTDATGQVQLIVQVKKYLRVEYPHSSIPSVLEEVPPHFTVPMLHRVLSDEKVRASVFLHEHRKDAGNL